MLALGESTHTHIMESKKDILVTEHPDEAIEFVLQGTGVITHEEHDRIVLNPGRYMKVNQVEYDPFSQTVQRVYD